MNSNKSPLGIRMAETSAKSNDISVTNQIINKVEDGDLLEFKQLLLKMNEMLDIHNFEQIIKNNTEMRTSLKELIIKSVTALS